MESLGASWDEGGAVLLDHSSSAGCEGEPAVRLVLRERRLEERRRRVARSLAEQQARGQAAADEAAARSHAAEALGGHLLAWTKRNKVRPVE